MAIWVLIERVEGNGYRARSGEPLVLTAEGATQDEALQKLRELIHGRIAAGAQVVELDVNGDPPEHPLARFAGRWNADDPWIQEYEKHVEDYRRERDEDPDQL
jgi:hypothetical protein